MKKPLFLLFFVVVTLIFGTIYGAVQQAYRQSANDPQIQMAEDAAASPDPTQVTAMPRVDLSKSLAPFLIYYDGQGRVTSSQAQLGGDTPTLPGGVLQNTTATHESRLTWQPAKDTRIAAIVVRSKLGYVLAGRSLREVEKREDSLFQMVALGWLTTLIVGGILLWWSKRSRN